MGTRFLGFAAALTSAHAARTIRADARAENFFSRLTYVRTRDGADVIARARTCVTSRVLLGFFSHQCRTPRQTRSPRTRVAPSLDFFRDASAAKPHPRNFPDARVLARATTSK
jgi:hypothetical protein